MEAVFAISILRKDGVLERMTDEEGMPVESTSRDEIEVKARKATQEPGVAEVYIRETYTIKTIRVK